MKTIIKGRWVILFIWVTAAIALTVFQPNINQILQQRGQSMLPGNSPSLVAGAMLSKMDTGGTDALIVFYEKNKISGPQMDRIRGAVTAITDSRSALGISHIVDPFRTPKAKSSLLSKDGTTLMVSFKLHKGSRNVADIQAAFDSKLKGTGVDYYLTGSDFITHAYLEASVSSVEKSAMLTILFILVILIFMFRSVITPLVSLTAVAFSYLVSMGIAAQLIDKAHFPVTTLTQLLLILILFGIGTDYNILLFNRFKEEMARGRSIDQAIITTYRTAGRTIAFSALTVLIAFFSLIFSESPIYKSGVVVVIGATVLLLEIVTLTPFAMKLLGSRFFWPSKSAAGHKESKLWGNIAARAAAHPLLSVALVLVIIAPSLIVYQQKLNFDQVNELGNAYPASKGYNLVADHFGKGRAMPSTLVLKSDTALNQNADLAVIDKLTDTIRNVKGVRQVSSVTRPQGNPISGFYTGNQLSAVAGGLGSSQGGLNQIADGFAKAQSQFGSADFSKAGSMADGTATLQTSLVALSGGLSQIQTGLAGGSRNKETLSSAIATIEKNLSDMSSGLATLSGSYKGIRQVYAEMGSHYQDAAGALLAIKPVLSQMQSMVTALGADYPALNGDQNYLGLKQSLEALQSSLNAITPDSITALNANYDAATAGFATANKNLAAMSKGLSKMAGGLHSIKSGVDKTSGGLGTIVTNMNKVAQGLGQMQAGQRQLAAGLNQFSSFGTRLTAVNHGLQQISGGLGQSQNFLAQFRADQVFHIPDQALTSPGFQSALDSFMSRDRKTTKLTIILDDDPYSLAAASTIRDINTTVSRGLSGTVLSGASFGVAGPSAVTNDTNRTLNSDLTRMIAIVLIGIFLVLLFLTRSFWLPVCITLSLIGAYFAAIFVANLLFIHILHFAGLSSFVPFFSFIIIVALGVDYNIFLMTRFKEAGPVAPKDAIIRASRQVGGVVISAAVILGGTFATLIPSGMLLLIQLAVAVITGLIVLCFLMLPIFLPAAISLTGKPFRPAKA